MLHRPGFDLQVWNRSYQAQVENNENRNGVFDISVKTECVIECLERLETLVNAGVGVECVIECLERLETLMNAGLELNVL